MSDGYTVPLTQPAPAAVTQAFTVPPTPAQTAPAAAASTPVVPAEPLAAQPNVTASAQADLSNAQIDLATAQAAIEAVDTDKLYLDKGSAHALIKAIATARHNVEQLYEQVSPQLDIQLQFGDNWVGKAISERLRTVAVGDEESAVSVVGKFLDVLLEVEHTVRAASGVVEQADEDAKDALQKIDGGES